MKWLVALETDNDPIPACRLMNIFRRKGVQIVTLSLAGAPAGFSLLAVVETAEAGVDHIFNFLRRVESVRNVTWYRQEFSAQASFVLVDADADPSGVARCAQIFPESKLVFSSGGKHLYEVTARSRALAAALSPGDTVLTPFTRAKSARNISRPELVGTISES